MDTTSTRCEGLGLRLFSLRFRLYFSLLPTEDTTSTRSEATCLYYWWCVNLFVFTTGGYYLYQAWRFCTQRGWRFRWWTPPGRTFSNVILLPGVKRDLLRSKRDLVLFEYKTLTTGSLYQGYTTRLYYTSLLHVNLDTRKLVPGVKEPCVKGFVIQTSHRVASSPFFS